jgi:acylphosphatase
VSLETIRFRVTGRVQGVGYRYFALTEAHALGVSGYARNLADGSVEVVAEAAAAVLVRFEERLRQGPAFSRVEVVDKEPLAPRGDQGFHIR